MLGGEGRSIGRPAGWRSHAAASSVNGSHAKGARTVGALRWHGAQAISQPPALPDERSKAHEGVSPPSSQLPQDPPLDVQHAMPLMPEAGMAGRAVDSRIGEQSRGQSTSAGRAQRSTRANDMVEFYRATFVAYKAIVVRPGRLRAVGRANWHGRSALSDSVRHHVRCRAS